jgi:capsid protein
MWPFNRKRKQRRNYGGAQLNRLTNDWVSQGTSADSEVKNSLRILRNRARALVRDSDFAKSALRAVKNNVVGQGIKHQAQVRMIRGGRLDERMNALIEHE